MGAKLIKLWIFFNKPHVFLIPISDRPLFKIHLSNHKNLSEDRITKNEDFYVGKDVDTYQRDAVILSKRFLRLVFTFPWIVITRNHNSREVYQMMSLLFLNWYFLFYSHHMVQIFLNHASIYLFVDLPSLVSLVFIN